MAEVDKPPAFILSSQNEVGIKMERAYTTRGNMPLRIALARKM